MTVLALQSAVDRSGVTLLYLGLAATCFLVADHWDAVWRTRVDASDRAYFRRLKARLLDAIGRSSIRDLSDEDRQAKLELQYDRAANVSNLVEQSAATPSYLTKLLLSGGALFAADWRVALVVSVAVAPGFWLKTRHTRQDIELEDRQARQKHVVDTLDVESYRSEGITRMVLGGLTSRIKEAVSHLQGALDREKDAHERRQNRQLLATAVGYYSAVFGGFSLLFAQYQAGGMEIGNFAFLCLQLKDVCEDVASHADTFQAFRRMWGEAAGFYRFVAPGPQRGEVDFPRTHALRLFGAKFERGGFAVTVPDLELPEGSLLIVHGSSGAGKTTLLDHLAFAAAPVEGGASVGGVSIADIRFSAWQSQIAYCGARPALLEGRTIRDILQGRDGTEGYLAERCSHPLVSELVVGLHSGAGIETRVGQGLPGGRGFSTGELHRLAIVSAVVPRPRILFLDEVTSNQSDEFIREVAAMLERYRALGTTVIFATHSKKFDGAASHIVKVSGGVAESQPLPAKPKEGETDEDAARRTA